MGADKENRVCKLKVEIFSLLISILIHLGLLTAPFSLSPPESTKYIRSIKVDYIISLPKINHHLRKSEKSIVSPLTLTSGRENKELLKPFSTLTKKPSISFNLRSQERILPPEEASDHRKRKSLFLFPSPIKAGVPIPESNSLREGKSKMVSNIPGVNLSIDKTSIFSSSSPLTRAGKSPLMRKTEGKVYLSRGENLSQKRLADLTSSLATKPSDLNQSPSLRQREESQAFLGFPSEEKKSEPMPGSYSPNLLLSKIKKPRVKEGLDLLNPEEKMPKQNKILHQRPDVISVAQSCPLRKQPKSMSLSSILRCLSEENKMEIERINYLPGCFAGSAASKDTGAWISQIKYERKYEPKIALPPLASIFPPERNLNSFPVRQGGKNYLHYQIRITQEGLKPKIIKVRTSRAFPYKKAALRKPNLLSRIHLGKTKEKANYEISSPSLDPIVRPGMRGYFPAIKEKKFSPLSSEPDFHQEEIRIIKRDTEPLTHSLRLREYGKKIRKLINVNKKYPPLARQRGWEGKIKVRFTINSSGRIIKTEVSSPCRYEVLNRAAEKLIKDTSPFPPFPASWHKNSLTVEVQVVYQLKKSTLTKEDGN